MKKTIIAITTTTLFLSGCATGSFQGEKVEDSYGEHVNSSLVNSIQSIANSLQNLESITKGNKAVVNPNKSISNTVAAKTQVVKATATTPTIKQVSANTNKNAREAVRELARNIQPQQTVVSNNNGVTTYSVPSPTITQARTQATQSQAQQPRVVRINERNINKVQQTNTSQTRQVVQATQTKASTRTQVQQDTASNEKTNLSLLDKQIAMNWNGDVKDVVINLANQADYKVFLQGKEVLAKVVVNEKTGTVKEILTKVAKQVDDKADIRISTRNKSITIIYK